MDSSTTTFPPLPKSSFTRKCTACKQVKEYRWYNRNRSRKDGYDYECRECKSERMRLKYESSAGVVTVARKQCSKCKGEFPAAGFKLHKSSPDGLMPRCRECVRSTQEQWRKRLRAELLAAYGNACACCGEAHVEFLALDHVYSDGYAHRKECKFNAPTMWLKLKKAGYPKDRYRLLYHNCNASFGTHGYCPHQRNGTDENNRIRQS